MPQEQERGLEVRSEKTERTISRVRKLMLRVHPDKLGEAGDEVRQAGKELNRILTEIREYPNDLNNWSHDLRREYPRGALLRLTGRAPDGSIRPILEVPLRRPGQFLLMLETYLDTGTIPEIENTTGEESPEIDPMAEQFLEQLANPASFEHLRGIRMAMRMHEDPDALRAAEVPARFDAAAEQLIGAEIAAGSLPLAGEHIKDTSFFDKQTAERLRGALAAKERVLAEMERDVGVGSSAVPTNATEFEARAAKAANIEELAGIAREAQYAGEKYAPRSIDTLAKQMFKEACDTAQTIEEYKTIQRQVRTFPFAQEEYGNEVKEIVGMRMRNFTDAEMIRGAKERGEEMSMQEVHTDALKEWNTSPLRRLANAISRIVRNKN